MIRCKHLHLLTSTLLLYPLSTAIARSANGSDAEIVWTQILQGLGDGFAAACSQVGAQASVSHVDLAMATAVILLATEIGASVGGSVGESTMISDLDLPFTYLTLPYSRSNLDKQDANETCGISP